MILQELIQPLGLRLLRGSGDTAITDVCDDSRRVTPGALFIARPGTKGDGKVYIEDALARGAAAVMGEGLPPEGWAGGAAYVRADRLDQELAGRLADRFFDYPSLKLRLVGVTGTKGKTTTAFIIQHLLAGAGLACGMIGTVVIDDGAKRTPAELTTPGAIDFVRYLAAMARHGCKAAVAEVSSHALHQGRVAALRFEVGVFTNLTGDHLDYHKTMEEYGSAKAILFKSLSPEAWAVVNADDPYGQRMARETGARVVWVTLGKAELPGHCCRAQVIELGADHSLARFDGPWGSKEIRLPLVGRHNVANALAALAAADAVTPMARLLPGALENCPSPPGRLEPVRLAPGSLGETALPAVVVDYAHTHDALEKVLEALRPLTRGKLVALFGCGGDRDRTKRPKMAAVACRLADRVVVTSDNPRTEDAEAIIAQVLAGVPADKRAAVAVEPDRAKAIAMAINQAAPGDMVLLAGKGHEDYQIIGTTKRHFDDREEAEKALEKRARGQGPGE